MSRDTFSQYRIENDAINTDTSESIDSDQASETSGNSIKSQNKMASVETVQALSELVQSLNAKCEMLTVKLADISLKLEASTPAVSLAGDREHTRENADADNFQHDHTLPLVMKDLKSHLELVTEFEGNNISVETFIFEIKTVLLDIPEDQRKTFIRLIISKKIIKNARKAIDGHDIRSSDDLFQALRNNFGESKSFDVAFLERSQCQQGANTVLEYNKKFNEYHLNVKRAINNNPEYSIEHRKITLINEENLGLSQYTRGLRQSIKLFVKASKPTSIREAQNLALETEKEETISRVMFRHSNPEPQRPSQRNNNRRNYTPRPSNNDNQDNTVKKGPYACHGCGSVEHFIKDCPKARPRSDFQQRTPFHRPPDQIKFTELTEPDETQEQPSTSESTAPADSDLIHSWQTQEHQ